MNDFVIDYSIFDANFDGKRSSKKYKIVDLTDYSQHAYHFLYMQREYEDHGSLVYHSVTERLEKKILLISSKLNDVFKKKLRFINSAGCSYVKYDKSSQYINGHIAKRGYKAQPRNHLVTLQNDISLNVNYQYESFIEALRQQKNFAFITRSVRNYFDYLKKDNAESIRKEMDNVFGKGSKVKLFTISAGNEGTDINYYNSIMFDHRLTVVAGHNLKQSVQSSMVFTSDSAAVGIEEPPLYLLNEGTSYSAPHTGGIGPFIYLINPNLSWYDYHEIIQNTGSITKREDFGKIKPFGSLTADYNDYLTTINSSTRWNNGGHPHNRKFGFNFVDPTAALLYTYSLRKEEREQKTVKLGFDFSKTKPRELTSNLHRVYEDFEVHCVNVSLTSQTQKVDDVYVTLAYDQKQSYPVLTRQDDTKDKPLDFTFGTIGPRGQTSQGQWSLTVQGTNQINPETFSAEVILRGMSHKKRRDIVFTNDYGSSVLSSLDTKACFDPIQRNIIRSEGVISNKRPARLNLSALYSLENKVDQYVIINLDPTKKSLINGQVVKFEAGYTKVNDLYGPAIPSWIVGNKNKNEIEGGPDCNIIEGIGGGDTYIARSYPWIEKPNHDYIIIGQNDTIDLRFRSHKDCLYYYDEEKNIGAILFVKFDKSKNILEISYKDSIFLKTNKNISISSLMIKDKTSAVKTLKSLAEDEPSYKWTTIVKNHEFSTNPILSYAFEDLINQILIRKGIIRGKRKPIVISYDNLIKPFHSIAKGKGLFEVNQTKTKTIQEKPKKIEIKKTQQINDHSKESLKVTKLEENIYHLHFGLDPKATPGKMMRNWSLSKVFKEIKNADLNKKHITDIKVQALDIGAKFLFSCYLRDGNKGGFVEDKKSLSLKNITDKEVKNKSGFAFARKIKKEGAEKRLHELHVTFTLEDGQKIHALVTTHLNGFEKKDFDINHFVKKHGLTFLSLKLKDDKLSVKEEVAEKKGTKKITTVPIQKIESKEDTIHKKSSKNFFSIKHDFYDPGTEAYLLNYKLSAAKNVISVSFDEIVNVKEAKGRHFVIEKLSNIYYQSLFAFRFSNQSELKDLRYNSPSYYKLLSSHSSQRMTPYKLSVFEKDKLVSTVSIGIRTNPVK